MGVKDRGGVIQMGFGGSHVVTSEIRHIVLLAKWDYECADDEDIYSKDTYSPIVQVLEGDVSEDPEHRVLSPWPHKSPPTPRIHHSPPDAAPTVIHAPPTQVGPAGRFGDHLFDVAEEFPPLDVAVKTIRTTPKRGATGPARNVHAVIANDHLDMARILSDTEDDLLDMAIQGDDDDEAAAVAAQKKAEQHYIFDNWQTRVLWVLPVAELERRRAEPRIDLVRRVLGKLRTWGILKGRGALNIFTPHDNLGKEPVCFQSFARPDDAPRDHAGKSERHFNVFMTHDTHADMSYSPLTWGEPVWINEATSKFRGTKVPDRIMGVVRTRRDGSTFLNWMEIDQHVDYFLAIIRDARFNVKVYTGFAQLVDQVRFHEPFHSLGNFLLGHDNAFDHAPWGRAFCILNGLPAPPSRSGPGTAQYI